MFELRKFYCYLLMIAICLFINPTSSKEELQIQLINIIFRHGDRTPENLYPNDPYKNYDFYPMGYGKLTDKGKERSSQLGKFLRMKYNNFLDEFYTPGLIETYSSDYNRTKMSLMLVLRSLFPPKQNETWNPIPTRFVPSEKDNILLADDCPLFVKEYSRVLKTPEVLEKMKEFGDMNLILTEKTGRNITTPLDMYNLFNVFMAEWSMNLSLPEWILPYFPNGKLKDGIIYAYQIANSNTLLKRLYGGPLLKSMIKYMLASKDGKLRNLKINLYSGHETNISSILHALGVYEPHVPEYSSAVILELLRKNKDYYVKILYYLGDPTEQKVLQIPGCKTLCPLNEFLKLTTNVIPSDLELICDKSVIISNS